MQSELTYYNGQLSDLLEAVLDRFSEYQIGEMWTGEDIAVVNAMRKQWEEMT